MFGAISKGIDWLNAKEGQVASLTILPLLGVVIYEVIMRYVFNTPTVWGFEATTFLYGIHYMLGCAFTDLHDGHVKVDIFSTRLSTRAQAVLGIITLLIFFMPVMTCMTLYAFQFAATSVAGLERNSTSWAPPIYPFKCIMALAFLFLWLQGLSNLIRQFQMLKK